MSSLSYFQSLKDNLLNVTLESQDKLFKDLGEQYTFEQSLRQFHSNPNTRIPNDQKSFAEFCYGNMVSCKEGNLFACARNKMNHNLY